MHGLLREVETERAREKAPKVNPFKFSDPGKQRLSDLWFSQRTTATVEQKDRVGLAYISTVVGLGDEAAQKFAQGDRAIFHEVGLRHAGSEDYNPDFAAFWREIAKIFPGTYTQEDLNFLANWGLAATWHLESQIEIQQAEESPVLRSLALNAHAYK